MNSAWRELHTTFIEQSSEGIWRFELKKPLDTKLDIPSQIEHIFRYGFLAECNNAMARMYGFGSAEEIIGTKLGELMPQDDENNITHIRNFIENDYQLHGSESHEFDKEGNEKFFFNNFFGIVEKGYLLRAWGTQTDITERKKIEKQRDDLLEKVQKQNAILDALFENAPIGLGLWDEKLRFVRVNKALAEINGMSEEEHPGKTLPELLPDIDISVQSTFKNVLKTGTPVINQVATGYTPAEPGKKRSWSVSYYPVSVGNKNIGVGAVCEEITDQIEADEERQQLVEQLARERAELAEQEERYRLAIDAGKIGTWDWDMLTNKITWSDRIYAFHGVTPDDFDGSYEQYQQLIHPDDREYASNAIRRSIEEKKPFTMERRVIRPDGSIRWISTSGRVIYDLKGKPVRMLGATVDITKQKELDMRKDEFLTIASHELKTPLTSIKGYTQIAHKIVKRLGHDEADQYLEKSQIYIDRLNALIMDLLDISRIQAGKLQFNMSSFPFDDMVQDAIESVQPTTSHRIHLSGKTDVSLLGDRDRIEQVLANLLTNAIKYSPDAESVSVSLQSTKAEVIVSVTDYGIGIKKEMIEKIFERFYRVEDVAQKFTGLGIGLYISKQIVERHGGNIEVKSTEGKGTTFSVHLPRQKQES